MADSITEALIKILEAGTWTTEPGILNVLESKRNMIGLAREKQSNNSTLLIMPPKKKFTYNEGAKKELWTFEFYLFYFSHPFTDAAYIIVNDQIDDLIAVLAAASPPTGYDNFYCDAAEDMTNRHDKHFLHVGYIQIEKWDGTSGLGGNTLWLKNLLNTNWDANIIAAPTMNAYIQKRTHYASGNYIFFKYGGKIPKPLNEKFRDETDTFNLKVVASSEANLQKMILNIERVINEDFYPSGSYMNNDDNTVALWHMNEAAGDCDNAEGTAAYDLTVVGATRTGSGYNSQNSITFDAADEKLTNASLFTHGTTYPIPSNGTFEIFFKFTSGVVTLLFHYDSSDFIQVQIGATYLMYQIANDPAQSQIFITNYGYQSDKWYKVMCTWGARGMELFVNDLLVGTHANTGTWDEHSTNAVEMGDSNSTALSCIIDEGRISDVQRGPYRFLNIDSVLPEGENSYIMDVTIKGVRKNVYG